MKKIVLLLVILFMPLNTLADTGSSTIVMEINSGRVLHENNIHSKKLIASITKIMTCIVVLENADTSKEIVVGDEIRNIYGTSIYLEEGEKIKINDLLYGLMLRSGNDAAIVLATNTLGIKKFVDKMNETAKLIGMKDTVFENPHGLDDNTKNYSTAYDMVLLSNYAYNNKDYRKIISTKKYITKSSKKSYVWYNRMSLLNKYKNCIGGKNGYTPNAGKTLVSYAKKNDMLLTIVSLNDPEIYNNHQKLYDYYFSKYHNYIIIDKQSFDVSNLINNNYKYYIKKSFKYPLSSDEVEKIRTFVEIKDDNKPGKIVVKIAEKKIGVIKIYKEKKKEKSFFQNIKNLFVR